MWPTRVQNLKSQAVAVAEIFQGVYYSKMCCVTLTTPTWGIVRHHKANTSRGQLVYEI